MNLYVGKGFDAFEATMHMLIGSKGCKVPGYIDCSAGRCFAFDCSGPVQEWFSPRATNEEAVERLNRWFGLDLYCSDLEDVTEPFVLGPLEKRPIDNLAQKYYRGGGIYVFCMPQKDSLLVHDPFGHPAVVVQKTEYVGTAEAIFFKNSGTIRQPRYCEILRAGMEIKRQHPLELLSALDCESRVPLQYAVRNYLCQITKVLQLIGDVVALDSTTLLSIKLIFAQILSVKIDDSHILTDFHHQLWDLIETIVGGVRV